MTSKQLLQQRTYSFYKRDLKDPAIAFSSELGKQIFQESFSQGTMEGFFKLIEQFRTQEEPAFCGLTSLCIVLNALNIDPRRNWKGVWRWFSEGMLDCCKDLGVVKEEGISMHQVTCLAWCNGAVAEQKYFGEFSESEFRGQIDECTRYANSHMIVSYSRKGLSQTGDGHFSPVGGYNVERDLVLILDTACFKYPPHWVPLSSLYTSMEAVDAATNKPRGYIKISAKARFESLLYTLQINHPKFQHTLNTILNQPTQPENSNGTFQNEEGENGASVDETEVVRWVQQICKRINIQDIDEIVETRKNNICSIQNQTCAPIRESQCSLLAAIHQLQLRQLIINTEQIEIEPSLVNKLVILILMLQHEICSSNKISNSVKEYIQQNSKESSLISLEVEYLHMQYSNSEMEEPKGCC